MGLVSGDTGTVYQVTCKDDQTKAVIDLTGSSILLRWRSATDTIIERPMTIANATGGIVTYQFATGEIISPVMRLEIQITDASGNVLTSKNRLRESVRKKEA